MSPSREMPATRFFRLLDVRDYLEIFSTRDALYQGRDIVTIIGSAQSPGFLKLEDAKGNIVTTEHWNLDFALKVDGDAWFIPELGFLATLSKSAAQEVAGEMTEFLPEPPICPSASMSRLRGAIRVRLAEQTSRNVDDAVQYLQKIDHLFSLIEARNWVTVQSLDSDIKGSKEWPDYLQIIAHHVEIDIWATVCDDSSPLPDLSISISEFKKAFPDLPLKMSLKDFALGRVRFDLAEYRIQDARESYKNNRNLLDERWFEEELQEAISFTRATFEARLEREILTNQGAHLEDLLQEAHRIGIALAQSEFKEANAECRRVDSLLKANDFDKLQHLRPQLKARLARMYVEDNIERWAYDRLRQVRFLIECAGLEEADEILSKVESIAIDSEFEKDRSELKALISKTKTELKEKARAEEIRAEVAVLLNDIEYIRAQLRSKRFSPLYSHSKLDDDSLRLIYLWRSNRKVNSDQARSHLNELFHQNDFKAGALWSARHAELAAMEYLAHFCDNIVDVSITQVTGKSKSWKTHDIECKSIPFDVKNARSSYSSPNNYSELCVADFKKERLHGNDVLILGAFSEYVRPIMIPEGRSNRAQILGSLSLDFLNKLDVSLQDLTHGKLFFDFSGRAGRIEKFFPGWMFDHPHEFYAKRDQALAGTVHTVEAWASLGNEAGKIPKDLLLLYCSFREPMNAIAFPAEDEWLATAVAILRNCGLSLPSLVVSVITICVIQASDEESGFNPGSIRSAFNPEKIYGDMPLGVYDPLGYVESMISVFELIYQHNRESLAKYSEFKLSGEGILRGRCRGKPLETIIAYCGGWKPDGPKCGRNPIHLGESNHCPNVKCRKLICPDCGFCAERCPECKPRQEGRDTSRNIEEWEIPDDDDLIPY